MNDTDLTHISQDTLNPRHLHALPYRFPHAVVGYVKIELRIFGSFKRECSKKVHRLADMDFQTCQVAAAMKLCSGFECLQNSLQFFLCIAKEMSSDFISHGEVGSHDQSWLGVKVIQRFAFNVPASKQFLRFLFFSENSCLGSTQTC